MCKSDDPFNPDLKTGESCFGFKLLRTVTLPENQAVFHEFRHEKTGAAYVHVSRDDEENSFSVAFKTVPEDATGVAHILEHTVLCGSRQYPVRDPFFSMLKRSLNSFMNAFTASDWTMYPFSTPNRKDFYNLMGVYLDAAFFPRLDPLSFKQEGHRLETETDPGSGDDGLVYKGVVYNEMKGAMSSPDQVCRRSLMNALYPDTTYRHNSGGDPEEIPSLTHEDLVAFHRRHYHPSNAFFYSYGNLPVAEHLRVIQEKVLKDFDAIDPNTDVPSQPRWPASRRAVYHYPLSPDEDPNKKSQACVAWLTADIRNATEVLVLLLLEEILLGNAASPLRKALMDSGLGSALSDATGFDPDNRDTLFSCGLKDVDREAASKVEAIVMEVLERLSTDGIDPGLVAAAVHQIEFHRKEVSNTPYPYGLKLLLAFGGSWFHGGDPVRVLQFDEDMRRIREEIASGPYLEKKIKAYFLDNPHRVLFELHPDQTMARKEEQRVAGVLADVRKGLTDSDLQQIRRDAGALERLQAEKEDLSVLPTLARGDIPPTIRTISGCHLEPALRGQCYEVPTAGIFYYSSAFGMGMLPARLAPLVPFFSYAMTKAGTLRHDYMEMAKRIDTYTGGIGVAARARTRAGGDGRSIGYLVMESKCLERNQAQMFDIIAELVGEFDFSNHQRLRQLLMEYRAGLESMVLHNGHRLAMSLAARRFLPQTALHETWYGISQLQYIKALTDGLDDRGLTSLAGALSEVGGHLFIKGNLQSAYIGETSALGACSGFDAGFGDVLRAPVGGGDPSTAFAIPESGPLEKELPREGWHTSSSVSFVAQCFQTVRRDHPDAPALSIISKMLRSLYLHREIREKGGAYGGFSTYNIEDGIFSFASYRDPQIAATLDAFSGASAFITSGDYADSDINEALLQVCSEIDRPDPPGPAARKAFGRSLVSLTDDMRRRFKDALLATTRKEVVATAKRYFSPGLHKKAVAVISGKEQLEAANREFGKEALDLRAI
jgi:Zn-dependent M16 (insulinase) family peptidase